QRADIAGQQQSPLIVVQIERAERLARIGLHRRAERVIAQHLAAQVIDGEDRHGALLRQADIGYTAARRLPERRRIRKLSRTAINEKGWRWAGTQSSAHWRSRWRHGPAPPVRRAIRTARSPSSCRRRPAAASTCRR